MVKTFPGPMPSFTLKENYNRFSSKRDSSIQTHTMTDRHPVTFLKINNFNFPGAGGTVEGTNADSTTKYDGSATTTTKYYGLTTTGKIPTKLG